LVRRAVYVDLEEVLLYRRNRYFSIVRQNRDLLSSIRPHPLLSSERKQWSGWLEFRLLVFGLFSSFF
jgi:hypothetical protein